MLICVPPSRTGLHSLVTRAFSFGAFKYLKAELSKTFFFFYEWPAAAAPTHSCQGSPKAAETASSVMDGMM